MSITHPIDYEDAAVSGLIHLSQFSVPISTENNPVNNQPTDRFQVPSPQSAEQQKTEKVVTEELAKQPTSMDIEVKPLNQRTVDLTNEPITQSNDLANHVNQTNPPTAIIEEDVSALINDLKNKIDSFILKNKNSEAIAFITSTLEQDLNRNVRGYLYQRKALIHFIENKHDEAVMAATAGKICSPTDQSILIALDLFHAQALHFQTCSSAEELEANKKNALELLNNCLQYPNIIFSPHFLTIINMKLSLLRDKSTIKEYSDFVNHCLATYPIDEDFRYILLQNRIRTYMTFALVDEALRALIEFQTMLGTTLSEKNSNFIITIQIALIQKKIEEIQISFPNSPYLSLPTNKVTCLNKAKIAILAENYNAALAYIQQGFALYNKRPTNTFPIELCIEVITVFNHLGQYQTAFIAAESCLRTQVLRKKQNNSISEIEVELLIQKITGLFEFEKLQDPSKQDFSSILSLIETGLKYANNVPRGQLCLLKSKVLNHTSQFNQVIHFISEINFANIPKEEKAFLYKELSLAYNSLANVAKAESCLKIIELIPHKNLAIFKIISDIKQILSSSIPEFKIPELPEDKRKKPDDPENAEAAKRQKQDSKKTE